MKQEVLTTIAKKNPILSRDNLDPIVLSDIEEKMIVQIAEYVREQFTTFDWRWDDHSEMHDKTVTSLFLVKMTSCKSAEKIRVKLKSLLGFLNIF
ncbi:hypothetical protein LEP1GSC124_3017 [Leptospira interrogans serovar Pyrogenes str. 200701872]|uniref:Uncharacterized protein n=1 Tax=Leptospira interrogans serovar Pyrogenes str. 200701872 TaxID=1193029 RepID=M6ZS87_LEPIR|nr:hypothetical protein LEP1GSC124_3017 [Leptospira interrogans serovar Pyrogenes str. 200701872]